MPYSAWFVGSVTIPVQNFTCNGNAASVPAGTYYLRHATGALSLISLFNSAVENAIGGGGDCTIRRSRQVHLDIAPATTVVWGSATILRDLLGFTGNLGSAISHLAPNVSPLLWSPGDFATPATVAGVEGYSVDHKTRFKSDDGSRSDVDFYGEETWQDLSWSHILPERLRVASGTGGGTFHEFYEQCAKLGRRFRYYEQIFEDDSSSTDVTWTSSFGPYVLRSDTGNWYRRNVANAEVSSPLELELHLVDELS